MYHPQGVANGCGSKDEEIEILAENQDLGMIKLNSFRVVE